MASPNNTVISLPGQSIVDTNGNSWTLVNGQVAVNGIIDPTTRNVIQMAYENGKIWQKNTNNLWWSKITPASQWQPPYGTAIDPIPNQIASANDSIVTVLAIAPLPSLTDASGNQWSISKGKVTLNGIADPTTAQVIEIATVNGKIWQENAAGLWWSKTRPSDPWGPTYGTSIDPVANVARTWFGGTAAFATPQDWSPSGIPQPGDTAIVKSGQVSMTPGFGNGVNFKLQGGTLSFTTSGTFNTGTWSGSGTVMIGYPQLGKDVVVTTTGINMTSGVLLIRPFIGTVASLAIHGNSNISGGALLDVQQIGTASLPHGSLENDGTITLNASTLDVGELSGHGVVRATNGANISVIGAATGETIQLVSAHLYVGTGVYPVSTAMQLLAPITDFGASSQITLEDTQATREVFSTGHVMLYNGSTMVANLRISGQSHIYASNIPAGSVLLTAYDTGHSIPITPS